MATHYAQDHTAIDYWLSSGAPSATELVGQLEPPHPADDKGVVPARRFVKARLRTPHMCSYTCGHVPLDS